MDYIIRDKSIITGKDNLEHLYTFHNFPVFLGCVDHEKENDILADMSRSIDIDTGMIQLNKLIPLDILYQAPHNDGVGNTWKEYYMAFAEYIKNQNVRDILEIGGGGGTVARNFTTICDKCKYYMVEPNPLIQSDEKIKVIKTFFDEKFSFNEEIDAVVHSQVFEHAYNPMEFIANISKFLKVGQKHIIAFPDIERFIKNNYTNGLNFEHTFLLNEKFADYFLLKNGFKILDKTRYNGYDLFYTLEKSDSDEEFVLDNEYEKNKVMFLNFISYYLNLIKDFNNKIKSFNGNVYLFGAHIFSQYLIGFGLDKENISGILDNSDLKYNKRLYGTDFIIKKPDSIRSNFEKGVKTAVILKAGMYQEEIKKQLFEICPNIEIWE